jgi:hypothetical protein
MNSGQLLWPGFRYRGPQRERLEDHRDAEHDERDDG